ncbi:hypothetical protein X759_24400 [Mesorhizobium sp. LSHC420B00]|nr:hypothetical protein X759_24400 [Mesorhizobium sp. LSHC420B00]
MVIQVIDPDSIFAMFESERSMREDGGGSRMRSGADAS